VANPTTNYGFVLPTPTDLVTDLPADFDVALQGVDTRLKALQPGTTAGDLAYSSATANTNTRLAIGTAGQVLTVNSGATAPEWATPASGGMTLLSTTTLSGTSTTVSSISGSYTNLYISVQNLKGSGADGVFFRFNGIASASNYYGFYSLGGNGTTAGGFVTSAPASGAWATNGKIIVGPGTLNTLYPGNFVITAQDYTKTTSPKTFTIEGGNGENGDTYNGVAQLISTTSAITSFTIGSNGGSVTLSGSVLIYGVK
jgi:hypothetical protein